jgi:hypothetical protein
MARLAVLCLLLLGTGSLHGEGAWGPGIQVAVTAPANSTLRYVAGAPGFGLGIHDTWAIPGRSDRNLIRPRADYAQYLETTQTSSLEGLSQAIHAQLSSLSLGADYLCRISGSRSRLYGGLGISEIRWAVASRNVVTAPQGGSVTLTGTAHWWRLGLGPVVNWRVSEQLVAEARVTFSRYDQQNLPANTGSIGLLWHF